MQRRRQRSSLSNSDHPRGAAQGTAFSNGGEEFRYGSPGLALASRGRTHGVRHCGVGSAVGVPEVERLARSIRPPLWSRQQSVLRRMLVRLREDADLDQAALASRLAITQSEVSKFERGERALDVLRLRAWLRALGIEFASFADALDRELNRLNSHAE